MGACGGACTCGARVERTKVTGYRQYNSPVTLSLFVFNFSTRIFQEIFNLSSLFLYFYFYFIFIFFLKKTKTKTITHYYNSRREKKTNKRRGVLVSSSSFSRIRHLIWVLSNSLPFWLQSANQICFVLNSLSLSLSLLSSSHSS